MTDESEPSGSEEVYALDPEAAIDRLPAPEALVPFGGSPADS